MDADDTDDPSPDLRVRVQPGFQVPLGREVQEEPYALLIFSGLMIFNFLSETLNGSSSLVQSNALLVKRTTVSPRLLPYALTLSTLFTFAINSLAFLIMYVWLNRRLPSPFALQLYVLVLAVAIFATGVGMIISAVSAYFRDVQQIVPLLTTALLFFSPVFFHLSRCRMESRRS